MAKETMYYGSSPSDEKCAQIGSPDYEIRAAAECAAYKRQLDRILKEARKEIPLGFRLSVKAEGHDFGSYLEVVARYDSSSEEAWDLALWLDNNVPDKWDAEALAELAK